MTYVNFPQGPAPLYPQTTVVLPPVTETLASVLHIGPRSRARVMAVPFLAYGIPLLPPPPPMPQQPDQSQVQPRRQAPSEATSRGAGFAPTLATAVETD